MSVAARNRPSGDSATALSQTLSAHARGEQTV
jgi:hypothetical protein